MADISNNDLVFALSALVEGVPHPIANMANAASLIYNSFERINWAGFYSVEGDKLVLGPFMGKPACIEIPMGRGVCGTAAKEDRTLTVADVHEFPGHIACDEASRSEIVVPLHRDGRVVGVLDIDSPEPGRFGNAEKELFEAMAAVIEKGI